MSLPAEQRIETQVAIIPCPIHDKLNAGKLLITDDFSEVTQQAGQIFFNEYLPKKVIKSNKLLKAGEELALTVEEKSAALQVIQDLTIVKPKAEVEALCGEIVLENQHKNRSVAKIMEMFPELEEEYKDKEGKKQKKLKDGVDILFAYDQDRNLYLQFQSDDVTLKAKVEKEIKKLPNVQLG